MKMAGTVRRGKITVFLQRLMSFMICLLLLILDGVNSVFNVQITSETPRFATVGDSTVVNCNITGSYQSINWYSGNTSLSNGQKYQIIPSTFTSSNSTLFSLVISSVQYSDATMYICQAVSSIDGTTVASDSLTLSVGDKSSRHLESDSMMTIYSSIACVLLAIIFIMAVLVNIERIKNWRNQLAVAIKKYFGKSSEVQIRQRDELLDIIKIHDQHEIFNLADPAERNILMEGTGSEDN